MKQNWQLCVLAAGGLAATALLADDPPQPRFQSLAGAFLVAEDHNYYVETEFWLPLWYEGPVALTYHHHDATPFLDLEDGIQAELHYERNELELELRATDWLHVVAVGGYRIARREDLAGRFSAYTWGGGFASPPAIDGDRWRWRALAGGFFDRRDLTADWWTDLYGTWRAFYFVTDHYLGSAFRASLNLSLHVESANNGGHHRAVYKGGPEIRFVTANGNRAQLELHWFQNDDNPFYGRDESGLLVALNLVSAREDDYLWHARQTRQPGWFPMIWGGYDVAAGHDRHVTRFEMNVEVMDVAVADRLVTFFIWYETHQEQRPGDFDNISYSVTLGFQSPVGLESVLSQGTPLVAGIDFLHRSDHVLNPDADRVAAVGEPTELGPMILNGSINILPRFRLQTIGWDLPYRDPTMYERRTAWLNFVDWRLTAGYTASSTRSREPVAGQVGLNWDAATLQGFVVYLRGLASLGDESPDWQAELGVRRPVGKVFARVERYGINRHIARGDIWAVGVGVNL